MRHCSEIQQSQICNIHNQCLAAEDITRRAWVSRDCAGTQGPINMKASQAECIKFMAEEWEMLLTAWEVGVHVHKCFTCVCPLRSEYVKHCFKNPVRSVVFKTWPAAFECIIGIRCILGANAYHTSKICRNKHVRININKITFGQSVTFN